MITILITCLMCSTSFVRTDTIIKDNPAQFNAIATDANGKPIPVSGEVDTIQVFDIHQLGQDVNDTGLRIDISVSPLNATNTTPTTTTTTPPPPPVKLSDLRFPETMTTFSKVPALVPQDHPFTTPLNVAIPQSSSNASDNFAYTRTAKLDQKENSSPSPLKYNQWATDQSGSNNASNSDASKFSPYANVFGARPFFGQWGGQSGRAAGPHADAEPYPINYGYRFNDTDSKAVGVNDKNQTSGGVFAFLTELPTKMSKSDSSIKGVDDSDYADHPNVDLSDKDDERINPGMYASNYWDPSRWNSFTNISFDEDGKTSASDKERTQKASVDAESKARWNNPWSGKQGPVEFASFNAFRIGNGTPIWMVNVSSTDATRLFQRSPPSFNLSNLFDTFDFANFTNPPAPIMPLLRVNPPPMPWSMNFMTPPKKATFSITNKQPVTAWATSDSLNVNELFNAFESQNLKGISQNPTFGSAVGAADNDTSSGQIPKIPSERWQAIDADDQQVINDGGETNDIKSNNVADLDMGTMLKGNVIEGNNGQSSILPVSLLLMIACVLTGRTILE